VTVPLSSVYVKGLTMSVSSLERKKEALEAVLQAHEALIEAQKELEDALKQLPPAWAKEVMEDLRGETESGGDEKSTGFSLKECPTRPSEAILWLLGHHRSGLLPSEITELLKGHIHTKSSDPKKLLYSAIIGLRRLSKVEKSEDNGKYRLVQSDRDD
jgi:exonuclease VII small subunit